MGAATRHLILRPAGLEPVRAPHRGAVLPLKRRPHITLVVANLVCLASRHAYLVLSRARMELHVALPSQPSSLTDV